MVAMFAVGESGSSRSPAKFKNRNRMEIVANLLTIAKTGALKTHLMYKANLSYVMITEYLDYLQSSGLLRGMVIHDGTKLYQTSEKGLRYIDVYDSLQDIAGMSVHMNSRSGKDLLA